MKVLAFTLGITSLVICGCDSQKALFQRFAPAEEDSFARRFMEAIQNEDYETATTMLDANLNTAETIRELKGMHSIYTQGNPLSTEIIGVKWNQENDISYYALSYQLQFRRSWFLSEIAVTHREGKCYIIGAHYNGLPESLETTNAFNLSNKAPTQYFFLVVFVLVAVLVVYAIILELKSKLRRKWLWVLFTLVGVGNFYLNWTTGEFSIQPISFKIPQVGFHRLGLYGPWYLYISIPVVAIIFLFRYPKRQLKTEETEIEESANMANAAESSNEVGVSHEF